MSSEKTRTRNIKYTYSRNNLTNSRLNLVSSLLTGRNSSQTHFKASALSNRI